MGKLLEKPEEVRQLVQRYVDQNQPGSYRLIVGEPEFVTGAVKSRWIVPIGVDRAGIGAVDLANRLVDIESLIEDETGRDIMLPPDISSIPGGKDNR